MKHLLFYYCISGLLVLNDFPPQTWTEKKNENPVFNLPSVGSTS